jgi:hypothetical protein
MVSSWAESGITDGLAKGAEDAVTFSSGQVIKEGVVGQATLGTKHHQLER